MKTLSVLFAFGLLFIACKLAARLNQSPFCPAAIEEAARLARQTNAAPSAQTRNGSFARQHPKRYLR